MRRFKVIAAVIAIMLATLGVSAKAATPAPQPERPCPTGMVCIYAGTTTHSAIIKGFNRIGTHNISITGSHMVVNWMWDKRQLKLYSGKKGTGTRLAVVTTAQRYRVLNLSLVHSLTMQTRCPVRHCFTTVPQ